jgi:type II secretory pathway pseudopilin PulG
MLKKKQKEEGFSIIELCCVMTVILIMSAVSLFYLSSHKKLYAAEDQAIQLSDILQEARQKSFTQKEVIRVEINVTAKKIRLIEENDPETATDDKITREINLYNDEVVKFDSNPSNIPGASIPPEITPVTRAVFSTSNHPLSLGNSVCTIRFMRNGTVTNAGTSATGAGALPTGVAVFIWKPKDNTSEALILKAITVGGGTGNLKMWNYSFNATAGNTNVNVNANAGPNSNWTDTRKTY